MDFSLNLCSLVRDSPPQTNNKTSNKLEVTLMRLDNMMLVDELQSIVLVLDEWWEYQKLKDTKSCSPVTLLACSGPPEFKKNKHI